MQRPSPDPFATPFFHAHRARQIVAIRDYQDHPRAYTFPTFFTHTQATIFVFTANEKAARALVPQASLHPIRVSRERCLFALAIYRYGQISDGMTGYNEVVVGVPVSTQRMPIGPAVWRKQSHFGIYVVDLPVDSEENCHRGKAIWGLPKTMREFSYTDTDNARSLEMRSHGVRNIRLTFPRGGRRVNVSEKNLVYSRIGGALQRTDVYLDGAAWQYTRLSPLTRAIQVEFGDTEIYRELRALDVDPRAWLVRDFASMSSALYPPRPA